MICLGPEVNFGLITEGREAWTLEPGKRGVGPLPGPSLITTGSNVFSGWLPLGNLVKFRLNTKCGR